MLEFKGIEVSLVVEDIFLFRFFQKIYALVGKWGRHHFETDFEDIVGDGDRKEQSWRQDAIKYEGITSAQTGESVSASLLKATRLIAVSGIANPALFHRLCTQLGLTIVVYRDFPDHHWYTDQDMSEMRQIIAINRLAGIIKFFLSSCV